MKKLLLSAALLLAAPTVLLAQQAVTPQEKGLSTPVVALMPTMLKNVEVLGLDEAQKAALDAWIKTAPAMRGALEDEAAALRAEMARLILEDAPVEERTALAETIGDKETALIMMRSGCVDNLRSLLTPEQFTQLLDLAKAQ